MVHQTEENPNLFLLHETSIISVIKPRYVNLSYDLLHQKYVQEGLRTCEIARQTFSSTSRIREALKRAGIPLRKRKGTQTYNSSNLPFGKKLTANGEVIVCPDEMSAVKLMVKMSCDGETFKAIGDELQKRGIKTKSGRESWTTGSIKRAIQRGREELNV